MIFDLAELSYLYLLVYLQVFAKAATNPFVLGLILTNADAETYKLLRTKWVVQR